MPDLWRTLSQLGGNFPEFVRQLEAQIARLPHAAAAVLAVVGLIVALLGSRAPVVRVVTFASGVGLGLLVAPALAPLLHVSETLLHYPLALGLAALGAAVPESIVFWILGGAGGVLSAALFPGSRLITFLPGFLILGAAGAIFFPWIAAGLSGLAGGLAFVMGLAACLPAGLGGAWLMHSPPALVAFGLAVGVLGAGGQLAMPTEEKRIGEDAGKAREREIKRSDRARDLRFKAYAKRGRKP